MQHVPPSQWHRRSLPLLVRSLPLLLVLIGVLTNILTPPHLTFTPVFVAAPLVAAPLLSWRTTALAGAVGTCFVALRFWLELPGDVQQMINLLTVLTSTLIALVVNRMVARRNLWVASARDIAEIVQRAVVPRLPPNLGDLQVAAVYRAAERDALIGGDLYAAQATPFGARLMIGDVRGKGVAASRVVSLLLGVFREAAGAEPALESVTARLEATESSLSREEHELRMAVPQEEFTTAVVVEIPWHDTRVLRFVSRGHPPPLLLLSDGSTRPVQAWEPGLPLGLGDLGAPRERVETVPFPPGAQLLLYTDGVSEARDPSGAFYDPAERLSGRTFPDPQALVDAVCGDVLAHTGGELGDDLAVLVVQRSVPGGGAVEGHSDVAPDAAA